MQTGYKKCQACGSKNFWFDRCMSEPCNSMHDICDSCGATYPCSHSKCPYKLENKTNFPKPLIAFQTSMKRCGENNKETEYDIGPVILPGNVDYSKKYIKVNVFITEDEE